MSGILIIDLVLLALVLITARAASRPAEEGPTLPPGVVADGSPGVKCTIRFL